MPTGIFIVVAGFGLLRPDLFDANPRVSRADAPRWIPYVLESALWISGALALHRWLSLLVLEGVVTRALGRPLPRIFQDLLGVVLMTGATVGVLVSVFDPSMSGFWAASGAIGVVLGLALRPIILDFFSGLGINLEHAYSIGDYVSISTNRGEPIKGWIEEIQWRTLRIRTRDGFIVIVPNSELATSAVTNYALPRPESRFHLEVRLDVDVPTDRALRILRSAAHEATGLPDGPQRSPAPDVLIWSADDSGVLYRIRFWLDPATLSSDTATHVVWVCVLQQLAKAGLSLAQP
ncbi:MAG: mechanosensitive ion channel family protein, partial [Verrucomicrobiota bacterium]